MSCEIAAVGFLKSPSPELKPAKKRNPPKKASKPNTTATCIHIFFAAGLHLRQQHPAMKIGAPINAGIQEVMDSLPIELTAPQMINRRPYERVKKVMLIEQRRHFSYQLLCPIYSEVTSSASRQKEQTCPQPKSPSIYPLSLMMLQNPQGSR